MCACVRACVCVCVCVCVNSDGINVWQKSYNDWVTMAISMKNNGCGTGINPVLPGTSKDVNETH